MKIKLSMNLLPSKDHSAKVFWNIISHSIMNTTIYYIFFILENLLRITVALRFSVYENTFRDFFSSWHSHQNANKTNNEDSIASSSVDKNDAFLKAGISVLSG